MKRLKILPFTMKYNLYTFHILFQLIIKIFSGSGHNHNNHLIKSAKICSANSPPVLVLTGRITSSFPRTVHSASVSNPSIVKNFCGIVICRFAEMLNFFTSIGTLPFVIVAGITIFPFSIICNSKKQYSLFLGF